MKGELGPFPFTLTLVLRLRLWPTALGLVGLVGPAWSFPFLGLALAFEA
jgi:hypothetical protein